MDKDDPGTHLARRAGRVGAAVLVSRLLGLAREQVIAIVFGAGRGPATDAFLLAFRIPNLLRDLFAEGALSAAFVPTFTAALREDRERAWRLFNIVLNALVILLGLIVLALVAFAPQVVAALASGYDESKRELATGLTRITAPFLLLVSLAALAMGSLNAFGRFFLPALAPAAFNVAMIACAIALPGLLPAWGLDPVAALAIGATLGGVLQLAVQIPLLAREGYRYRPLLAWRDPGLARIAGMMGPAVIGLAIVQLSILIDTQFASRILGDGPLAWLNFAFRIMYLPIGVVGVGIGTVHLVEAARHAAAGEREGLLAAVERAVRLTAFLALPAMAGLIALRVPLVRLLYEHGAFTPADTQATADALLWYAAAVFTYASLKVFVPTFYALGDARTPLLASACAIGAKILASALLVGPMGHAGLALSTLLATVVNAGLLALALRRRAGRYLGPGASPTLLKMALAAAAMGGAVYGISRAAEAALGHATLWPRVAGVALAVSAGVALYAGACLLLRVDDLGRTIDLLRRRPARPPASGSPSPTSARSGT
jgi:putative peptidoglycan lipid II flippase